MQYNHLEILNPFTEQCPLFRFYLGQLAVSDKNAGNFVYRKNSQMLQSVMIAKIHKLKEFEVIFFFQPNLCMALSLIERKKSGTEPSTYELFCTVIDFLSREKYF